MNFADYCGIPYSFANYNCWHHAVAVRADIDIETPEFFPSTMADAYELITNQSGITSHGLVSHETPENFDIVIVSRMKAGKEIYHCGVWYDGMVSHCSLKHRQVTFESFDDFKHGYSEVQFWR